MSLTENQRKRRKDILKNIPGQMASLRKHNNNYVKPPLDIGFLRHEVYMASKDLEVQFRTEEPYNRSLKTTNPNAIMLKFARHFYGRYPVIDHLEKVWGSDKLAGYRWVYVVAATGGSLYKYHMSSASINRGHSLSRKECHFFLTCKTADTPQQALIYAFAKGEGASDKLALQLMKSKITTKVARMYLPPFWRQAVHFFVHNPPPHTAEINDLYDYLERVNMHTYSFKGRTLESLRKAKRDWIYEMNRMQRHGGGSWTGIPTEDYHVNKGKISFVQLLTGDALVRDGSNMHHCVAGYKHRCMAGNISIWSMRENLEGDMIRRTLTMEIDNETREIVQCRGFGNRKPNPQELDLVYKFCGMRNFRYSARGGW